MKDKMEKELLFNHIYIFHSFVFLLYGINVFIHCEAWNYFIGMLTLLMLLVSLPEATRTFKILASSFIVIGTIGYMESGQSLIETPAFVTSNLPILSLLSILPLMSSVVHIGRYDRTLKNLLNLHSNHMGGLYVRSAILTIVLSAFLNLSALTISQEVLKNKLRFVDKDVRDSFIRNVTIRAYTLALLWSPLEMLLAMSLLITNVSYDSVLIYLLLITLIAFLIDTLWGNIRYRKYSFEFPLERVVHKKQLKGKIIELFVAITLFLALIILIGRLLNLNFIFTVTLLIPFFSLSWASIIGRKRSFLISGWVSWKKETNNMQNFILLFISLSYFSNGISGSSVTNYIQDAVLEATDYPLLIFLFIQIIFIVLSVLGVHPVATIGIFSSLVLALEETVNPTSLALVIIAGAISTVAVGTFNLVVQLTSRNTQQSPFRITLSNLPYAMLLCVLGILFAYLLL